MDPQNAQSTNPQAEPQQRARSPNKNFIISILVIILITPLYAFGAYLFFNSPRKLTMVIISYALIIPWWLLMAKSWTLEMEHPVEARKWRWISALLQLTQAILPLVCLEWWKMSLVDAFSMWAFSIFYLTLACSMHSHLLTSGHERSINDDNTIHPALSQEMV